MIGVAEAKKIIKEHAFVRRTVKRSMEESVGFVLSEDVCAAMDIPAFNQSSMDGYAIAFDSWTLGKGLEVVDEVPAGKQPSLTIPSGAAARIFTGAALPDGTDTVIMQEMTKIVDGQLYILDDKLMKGVNVRPRGAEIRKGELALKEGSRLSPAAIGFLSAIGIAEVSVFDLPSVAILVTGDELQEPGKPLSYGQVYEASSTMLHGALHEMEINEVAIFRVKDTLADTSETLKDVLKVFDVILLTGGVSVGDYDFVVPATIQCGVEQFFHRLKQRPGKPLFFGRKGNRPVFGLPGNPSSVLTCFYEYVWPVLRHLSGYNDTLLSLKVSLIAPYNKKNALTHYLKGYYKEGRVQILEAQESFRLRSFAAANCFVVLDEEMRSYKENELVEIHLLPQYG